MNTSDIVSVVGEDVLKAFFKVNELNLPEKNFSVEAIDIGYGYTKYTTGYTPEGGLTHNLFPSLASLSPTEEMGGDFFIRRNTKTITDTGGVMWEVGPDASDIKSNSSVRALHENFVQTEQWLVLLKGALAYIGKDEIDVLVLGLPVSGMKKRDEVIARAEGSHMIGNQKVTIKKVVVIPQPLGALYNHAITSGEFNSFLNSNTLVIDTGYLTFDFLVTKGFSVNGHRTNAKPGGMHSILKTISDSISEEENIDFNDLEQIDDAIGLKEGGVGNKAERYVSIYGKKVNLKNHIKNTKPVIESNMNFMLQNIYTTTDISNIVLAGGPNMIFEKSIADSFKDHNPVKLTDGIFSNVKGFWLYGLLVGLSS
jgi:plasmid segregation protein ParM